MLYRCGCIDEIYREYNVHILNKVAKKVYRKIFSNKDNGAIYRVLHPARISLRKTRPVSDVFGFDRGTPIDRYYIEKFLGENQNLIKGNVLEIADSTYSKRFASGQSDKFHVLTFDSVPENENIISEI